jgi:nitroimidazol reductase NimA-like FMN-containing flavoprotein (pyridoxamine 5'-phosphate oxidase superfamily)
MKPFRLERKDRKENTMLTPRVSRPDFPKGYVDHPKSILAWDEVEKRLVEATHYWICSVRPNHNPHVIPRWAVWVEGRLYYDGSPETRHAKNIEGNPNVAMHLESGAEAVILYGMAQAVPQPEPRLAELIANDYRRKYKALGYAPEANQWDAGGLFSIAPKTVIAWTSFMDNPTRFTF